VSAKTPFLREADIAGMNAHTIFGEGFDPSQITDLKLSFPEDKRS